MPTYEYACPSCQSHREDDASMSSFKDHHPPCLECGGPCDYTFVPTVVQVAFKDGPSGSWPSKGEHFKNYRSKRDEEMKRRQLDRYGPPRGVLPNYGGQETGSWAEAQFQALKDKGAESAATFTEKVKDEQSKDTKIKIAT